MKKYKFPSLKIKITITLLAVLLTACKTYQAPPNQNTAKTQQTPIIKTKKNQ